MPRLSASVAVCGVLAAVLALTAAEARDLSFDERVAAQTAIERVYWNHRIWPAENPGQKPGLSEAVPEAVIRAKVEDYLEKSNALEAYWQRPITGQQLQAEIDRMARSSKAPEMLRELFEVLGNDAFLIAETLGRQKLADRLIRNAYARDERFHGDVRARAKAALAARGAPRPVLSSPSCEISPRPEATPRPGAQRTPAMGARRHEKKSEPVPFLSLSPRARLRGARSGLAGGSRAER